MYILRVLSPNRKALLYLFVVVLFLSNCSDFAHQRDLGWNQKRNLSHNRLMFMTRPVFSDRSNWLMDSFIQRAVRSWTLPFPIWFCSISSCHQWFESNRFFIYGLYIFTWSTKQTKANCVPPMKVFEKMWSTSKSQILNNWNHFQQLLKSYFS